MINESRRWAGGDLVVLALDLDNEGCLEYCMGMQNMWDK